jgi:hypothetical protein
MIGESVKFASLRLACRWVVCAVVVMSAGRMRAAAQAGAGAEPGQIVPQVEVAEGLAKTYTMRVQSHEVIVDVVALGAHHQPVSDLKQDEFRVFEVGKVPTRLLRRIVAFRAVDPTLEEETGVAASGGFQVKLGGGCAMSFTRHYRLAFNPTPHGWMGGKHELVVSTSRPHVTLAYAPEYYVGLSGVHAKPKLRNDKAADSALADAACGRSTVPASIALNARLIRTADTDPLRISVVVQPDSLPFTAMSNGAQRVRLDYGACTFDAEGKPLSFAHTSAERVLSAEDYAHVMGSGFPNVVNVPRSPKTAMVRFVVMDRETGNMGSADVIPLAPPIEGRRADSLSGLTPMQQAKKAEEEARQKVSATADVLNMRKVDIAKMLGGEAAGTFGSIVASPGAMCGDVYELKDGTARLPDYWNHLETGEPVGAVYTDSLKVPYEMPEGIPGLTSRTEWFGIDYHGNFWIQTAGKYQFQMFSDDGAELDIDDKLVAEDDGVHSLEKAKGSVDLAVGMHTIHVPYFQQTVHVGLILIVQPPGEAYRVFDVRKFSPPAGAEARGGAGGGGE